MFLSKFRNKPDLANTPIMAYRCYGGEVEVIQPVEQAEQAEKLSDALFQSPGMVSVGGKNYKLEQDGVYRFFQLDKLSEQRIVCGAESLNSLMNMLGYLWKYGNTDDALTDEVMCKKAMNRTIVAGCGSLSRMAIYILNRYRIEARLVAGMTLEDWNGYDDGHTCLEVKNTEGKWCLYDPSYSRLFEGKGIADVCADASILPKILTGQTGSGSFERNRYNYDFWIEQRALSVSALGEWYRRVFQVPLIYAGTNFVYPEEFASDAKPERFSQRYVSMKNVDFFKTMYGENNPPASWTNRKASK